MRAVSKEDITGLILAGGRGSRMGGADKGLARLRGRPLIEYAIDALRPQVGRLLISANRNAESYAAYGRVIADMVGEFYGPLAGLLSGLRAADTAYVLAVPCDAPAIPSDLKDRLVAAMEKESREAGIVSCNGQLQPVFALVSRALAEPLQEYLLAGGRGVERWMREQRAAIADFSGAADFMNINTPEQLRQFQERAP